MDFSGRVACTLGCGSGIGTGGTVAHQNSLPYTWRELLEKEGTTFLNRDHDYYGIFYDQKSELEKEKVTTSSDKVTDAAPKIKEWCEKKLNSGYEGDEEKTRKNIFDYCTPVGITSLKGKLGQIGQIDWIDDQTTGNKDDLYKTIFAIYRYDNSFLGWLNEGKEESKKLKDSNKPSEKYSELKNKCATTLKKKISEVTETKEYGYASWWCQPLPYKKVKEKLEMDPIGWKERTDWQTAVIWNEVDIVKNKIKGRRCI